MILFPMKCSVRIVRDCHSHEQASQGFGSHYDHLIRAFCYSCVAFRNQACTSRHSFRVADRFYHLYSAMEDYKYVRESSKPDPGFSYWESIHRG